MPAFVDHVHRAGAELLFESILPELLGLDRSGTGLTIQPGDE